MEFDQTLHTIKVGNSQCTVSQFGGQLMSWNINGTDIIFENQADAIKDGVTAYRGGAPICFPYFGKGALLNKDPQPVQKEIIPQHGASRTTLWKLLDHSSTSVTVETIQPAPGNVETEDLRLTVQYSLKEIDTKQSVIEINAAVENISKIAALYQLVFHTYWACLEPKFFKVDGLGSSYFDNLEKLSLKNDSSFENIYPQPIDRVYRAPLQTISIETPDYFADIVTEDLPQAVVWNPGTAHTLKDLKAPQFFCIESGIINPVPLLESHQRRLFKLSYSVAIK